MTTEDYRGCTRGTLSRDSPSLNDKDSERHLPGSSNSTQICHLDKKVQVVFFYITGTRYSSQLGECRGHTVLETFFQKLKEKAITPHRATSGSVDYDLFMPIDFVIQPQEQKIIFTDLAVSAPEGYYAQLMSKSGLTVLYELEVKAGVVDPDFTGNIGVVLKNNSNKPIERVAGNPIAQLLFI